MVTAAVRDWRHTDVVVSRQLLIAYTLAALFRLVVVLVAMVNGFDTLVFAMFRVRD